MKTIEDLEREHKQNVDKYTEQLKNICVLITQDIEQSQSPNDIISFLAALESTYLRMVATVCHALPMPSTFVDWVLNTNRLKQQFNLYTRQLKGADDAGNRPDSAGESRTTH